MTKRKPPISEQQRALLAANKRRCRKRQSKGQKVFKITAFAELVIDLLVHKGHLPDIPVHDHAMIEAALAQFIDDEGRK